MLSLIFQFKVALYQKQLNALLWWKYLYIFLYVKLIEISNYFLQLLVYCIVTSINSMMDFIMQFAQLFLNSAQYFFNGVDFFFPNTVGEIPYAAEVVSVLMVTFLLFVTYRIFRCFLRTLKVFVGILCQFLCVFCACYLALVVYNDHGKLIDFVESTFAVASSQFDWLQRKIPLKIKFLSFKLSLFLAVMIKLPYKPFQF